MLLALLGCGPIPEVVERQQYWLGETDTFFQQSRNLADVHSWLRQRVIVYSFGESDVVDGNWNVTLERIYVHRFRCEWMDIRLYVTVDDSHHIRAHSVSSDGPCLW